VNDFQAHELTPTSPSFASTAARAVRRATTRTASWTSGPSASQTWSNEVDVFAYFNNDWEGYAIENALYVKERLGQPAETDAELLAFANAAESQ